MISIKQEKDVSEQANGQVPVYLPRINEAAPDFTAKTTLGEIKLSDFKGKKWVVLFSHPADFTPVCTTEFLAFAKNQVATPENWHGGDACIVLAPQTTQVADKRASEGYEYTDWYFSKKAVNP